MVLVRVSTHLSIRTCARQVVNQVATTLIPHNDVLVATRNDHHVGVDAKIARHDRRIHTAGRHPKEISAKDVVFGKRAAVVGGPNRVVGIKGDAKALVGGDHPHLLACRPVPRADGSVCSIGDQIVLIGRDLDQRAGMARKGGHGGIRCHIYPNHDIVCHIKVDDPTKIGTKSICRHILTLPDQCLSCQAVCTDGLIESNHIHHTWCIRIVKDGVVRPTYLRI